LLLEIHQVIETLQARGEGADARRPDQALVERLRAGDEAAFVALVDDLGPAMLRVARLYVRHAHLAEEVVQETWLRVLRSLAGFEGRSSLRTWIFAILANCGRRRAQREGRYVPVDGFEPAPRAEDRFFSASHPRWAGMWSTRVDDWGSVPEDRLLAREGRERLREALGELSTAQAVVFVLRDVDGWNGNDVCEALTLTPSNQRVLLHRARAHIRRRMEEYLSEPER
jgi:RNA polymerase sigma-70 factor, ECF subfamily